MKLCTLISVALISTSANAGWKYSNETDKLGRGITTYAESRSLNTVDFAFPYNGGTHAEINLRASPKFGKQAFIWVNKGQFNCRFNGCTVSLRIDGGKPIKWTAHNAEGGHSNAIFLSNYTKLVALLRPAKKLQVEAPFWREGDQVFEFDVAGLTWK